MNDEEPTIIIPRKPGVHSNEYSLSNKLSYMSNESAQTFSKQPNKLVPPVSKENVILNNVKTDRSGVSVGEIITDPGIKLKNKFNEIQLKLWDKEEIYNYLWTLDFIQNNQYTIERYYHGGKDIKVWVIVKADAVDITKEWTIRLSFFNDIIAIGIKWETEVDLLKELLDWLHSLTFQFYFYINSEYLEKRK